MATSRFEAYRLHGHIRPGSKSEAPVDYHALGDAVLQRRAGSQMVRFGSRVIAVRAVRREGNTLTSELLVGNAEDELLILDVASGAVQSQTLTSKQVPVRSVMVGFDPTARLVVVEKRRPGATIPELERFFALVAQGVTSDQSVAFTLAPLASKSFATEVHSLTRIRSAKIRVARPNFTWTEDAETLLEQEGGDTNAAKLTVEAHAHRGSSLSLTTGMVPEIISLAERANPSVEDASVTGREGGSGVEKVVRLARHIVHRFRDLGGRDPDRAHAETAAVLNEISDSEQSTDTETQNT